MERLKKVCDDMKPTLENYPLKLAPEFKLFQRNQLKFSILFTVLTFGYLLVKQKVRTLN